MWPRFLLAGVVDRRAAAAAAAATAGLRRSSDLSRSLHADRPARRSRELTAGRGGARRRSSCSGSDVRNDRRACAGRAAQLGHDDPRPPEPEQAGHALLSIPRDLHVDIPGYGTRQDQRGLPRGRHRLTRQDDPAAPARDQDQPRRQRRLQGLHRRWSTGSAASTWTSTAATSTTTPAYADDRHPARLPEDVRLPTRSSYARFRHEDTDLVRGARQQDFLRQARRPGRRQDFLPRTASCSCASSATTPTPTTARRPAQILSLLKLVAFSAGHPLKEVQFRTDIGPPYETSSPEQISATVHEFLDVKPTKGPRGVNRAAPSIAGPKRPKLDVTKLGLEDAKTAGEDQAIAAAPHVQLPRPLPAPAHGRVALRGRPPHLRDRRARPQRYQAYRIVTRTASWAPTTASRGRPGRTRRSSRTRPRRRSPGAARITSTGT